MRKKPARYAVYCIAEIISESPLRFTYFKIGITTDLKQRVRGLQTANPRKLAVILADWFRTMEDARAVEKRAHRYLEKAALSGEWFHCSDDGSGCPFEAMAIATSDISYVPASDLFYDNQAPDWEPFLLATPKYYPGARARTRSELQ